jgi:hypothetical protein
MAATAGRGFIRRSRLFRLYFAIYFALEKVAANPDCFDVARGGWGKADG